MRYDIALTKIDIGNTEIAKVRMHIMAFGKTSVENNKNSKPVKNPWATGWRKIAV